MTTDSSGAAHKMLDQQIVSEFQSLPLETPRSVTALSVKENLTQRLLGSDTPKRKRKKTSRQNLYIGKAGQLAVMAELALRGYNVALPEVDKGDDIFVMDDHSRKVWRVQVKAATEQEHEGSGKYQVVILEKQITTKPPDEKQDLYFVFALRLAKAWRFIVIPRATLKARIDEREAAGKKFGSLNPKDKRRTISINVSTHEATSGQVSKRWLDYMEDWNEWPKLNHDELAYANLVTPGIDTGGTGSGMFQS